VNYVCPGPVQTPLLQAFFDHKEDTDAARRTAARSTLLNRISQPEEIAAWPALPRGSGAPCSDARGQVGDHGRPYQPVHGDAVEATALSSRYRLRAADTTHLATAVGIGADRFITNNPREFTPAITEIAIIYPADLPDSTG